MMIADRRRADRQLLGRGDAVHAGHVDVEQDDVDALLAGKRDRLRSGRDTARDVDVRLEAQQLGQVVACLGDVVDDDDVDLISHGRRSCAFPRRQIRARRSWRADRCRRQYAVLIDQLLERDAGRVDGRQRSRRPGARSTSEMLPSSCAKRTTSACCGVTASSTTMSGCGVGRASWRPVVSGVAAIAASTWTFWTTTLTLVLFT